MLQVDDSVISEAAPVVAIDSAKLASEKRAKARTQLNRYMKLVRRAHLYAGLFMLPWVFLYGGTALLFNHPEAFPDQDLKNISPADLAGTQLADFPAPKVLATRVVETLNEAEAEDSSDVTYELVRPDEAGFAREFFTTLTDGKRDHVVRIDLASLSGTVRSSNKREERAKEAPAPFVAHGNLRLDPAPLEAVTKSLPEVLARIGIQSEKPLTISIPEGQGRGGIREAGGEDRGGPRRERAAGKGSEEGRPGGADAAKGAGRRGQSGPNDRPAAPVQARGVAGQGRIAPVPELAFFMKEKDQADVWKVSYNLQSGALSGRLADQPSGPGEPLSTRRYLLRLHTAHGYPGQWFSARWIWAVAVDLMFVCMVGWGLTGAVMWWQMKNVRRVGAIVLVLGILASLFSAIGMHSAMVGGP